MSINLTAQSLDMLKSSQVCQYSQWSKCNVTSHILELSWTVQTSQDSLLFGLFSPRENQTKSPQPGTATYGHPGTASSMAGGSSARPAVSTAFRIVAKVSSTVCRTCEFVAFHEKVTMAN